MPQKESYRYKYIDKVKSLVPAFYIDEDLKNGNEEDILYKVLGKSLLLGSENSQVFSVSGKTELEVQSFFIPANQSTEVTPQVFQEHVLSRYGKTFSDFKTVGAFTEFLSGTIQPDIALNTPSTSFVTSATGAPYSNLSDASDVHDDLVSSLGLMYFLNSSGVAGTTSSLSGTLTSYVASSVYYGKTFDENEGIKCLFDYVWTGKDESTVLNRYLPFDFQSVSSTVYLDNLKTLLGVWYSSSERGSSFIEDSYSLLNTSGLVGSKFESAGPMLKFLKAISYGFYDMDNLIEEVADLMDIDKCPPEFLDYLAGLIGWKLVGGDIDSWRSQLRQAVYVYKSKGTRQGLVDAIQYVFPRDITTFDASSDIKEAFESYLPSLIYYALKTESDVCQDFDTLAAFIQSARSTSDVVYNLSPNNHDKNIRFMVDAILEELDKEFNFIDINGVHYKETDAYANQTPRDGGWIINGESVTGKGYEHRDGFMVAVPPWEVDRFYATTRITDALLTRLGEILSECNEGNRYGISESFLSDMLAFIRNSVGIDTEEENFYFGNNNGFKFYTSSLEYAPNFDSVVAGNIAGQVQALDYWNTKSSNLFVSIEVGDLDESNGVESLTPSVITNISRTLQEFTPFHATTRIYIGIEVSDENPDAVDSIVFEIKACFNDANTTVLNSLQTSGWLGTSGAGNYLSSLDAAQLANGRPLPSPDNSFWSVYSGIVERDASRRRDYKYEIVGEGYDRSGKNQPISNYFYGSSLSGLETTKEFIPKGFNFSGQHFISPESFTYSSVYSPVNSPVVKDNDILYSAPSGDILGVPVSSTLNIRAVDDVGEGALPTDRRLSSSKIYKVFVDRLLRLGVGDTRHLVFDAKKIQEIELGSQFHELWNAYRREFENNLEGSGYTALNHAFGPLVYNSDMSVSGPVGDATTSALNAYRDGTPTLLDDVQFQYIIGADGIKGEAYRTHDGQLSLVSNKGLVHHDGWASFKHELEDRVDVYTNRSQVSSVEFSFDEGSDTIAVVNYPFVVDEGCSQRRLVDVKGVSFFSGREGDYASMRYPLIRNKNYINDYVFTELNNWEVSGGEVLEFSSESGVVTSSIVSPSSFHAFEFSGLSYLSSISGEFIKTLSLKGLVPNETYDINYSLSAEGTNNTVGWILANVTRSKAYSTTSNTWLSARLVNLPSLAADTSWRNYTDSIVVDPSFQVDDHYVVYFGLNSDVIGGTAEAVRLRNPVIRETKSNTFIPNRHYSMNLEVDSSSFGGTHEVQVRVRTGEKRHDGKVSQSDFFEYDFLRRRWQLKGEATPFTITIPDGKSSIPLAFHTDNLMGPLNLQDRSLRKGKRYANVHSDDTYYYVEIVPVMATHTSPNDLLKPMIRFESVSISDLSYESVPLEYTRNEAKLIMEFLDTLPLTLHSRDSDITESLGLGLNGGSRLVYMERYGGTFTEADTAGVTYYNI